MFQWKSLRYWKAGPANWLASPTFSVQILLRFPSQFFQSHGESASPPNGLSPQFSARFGSCYVFMSNADELMVSEKTAHNYLNAGLFDADITQHFRCQTENFQGCDLPLQKSKRQSDLWEFFAFFPISCLMLLILTHSTPLKREFPHTCKSESKFLNFAVAFTLTNLHLLLQVSKNKQISR